MNQLAILLNFSRQDLVDRYANSLLGVLWAFLFPLVNILVFVLVFSKIMGAAISQSHTISYGGPGIYRRDLPPWT